MMTDPESAPSLWYGVMEPCAFCGTDLTTLPTFADCDLRDGRGWGLVCPRCIEHHGLRIRPGAGQLYENRPGQRPVCIAGER